MYKLALVINMKQKDGERIKKEREGKDRKWVFEGTLFKRPVSYNFMDIGFFKLVSFDEKVCFINLV
jgi:hypothetical protein